MVKENTMKIKRFIIHALILSILTALLLPTVALAASGGGSGTLTAWGTGKGVVSGGGSITATGNGDLWIYDAAGDAHIYIQGTGVKHEFPSGWIHYEGFNGYASVSGSQATVAMSGSHIRLYAHGSGRFALRGQGNYHTSGSGWTLDTSLIESTPGEVFLEQK